MAENDQNVKGGSCKESPPIIEKIVEDAAEEVAEDTIGVDALRRAVDQLATLSGLEYESVRRAEADRLGIRTTKLDSYVKKARKEAGYDEAQGQRIELKEQEPWPEPVNGSDLLFALVSAFKKYLFLPEYGGEILALWTLHAHTYESSYHTPRLAITAPERECGKTVLLDVLESLTPRSIRTENCTTAVLFRLIHGHRPTVLLDEFDSFLTGNEDLRGALNAGHRKGGLHMRCEGDDNEVKGFKTFAPVAIAGIGALPEGTNSTGLSPLPQEKRLPVAAPSTPGTDEIEKAWSADL